MERDGFRVAGLDGRVERSGLPADFGRPPTLEGVRPDAWGCHSDEGLFAFVEAKTEGDINNRHTRDQLRTLSALRMSENHKPCPVYVVIPRGAAYALDRVLIDLRLLRSPHIRRVHVPSVMLEY
jgi:hypothetical protein